MSPSSLHLHAESIGGSFDDEDPLLVQSILLDMEDIGMWLELLLLPPELRGGSRGRCPGMHLDATGGDCGHCRTPRGPCGSVLANLCLGSDRAVLDLEDRVREELALSEKRSLRSFGVTVSTPSKLSSQTSASSSSSQGDCLTLKESWSQWWCERSNQS